MNMIINMNGFLIIALIIALIISLILTLIVEIGFFYIIGKRNKKDLLLVVLVNILTNPSIVSIYWILTLYTSINQIMIKILLEFSAVIAEGYYYRKYGMDFKRPYLFSFAANSISFGTGILLQQILHM